MTHRHRYTLLGAAVFASISLNAFGKQSEETIAIHCMADSGEGHYFRDFNYYYRHINDGTEYGKSETYAKDNQTNYWHTTAGQGGEVAAYSLNKQLNKIEPMISFYPVEPNEIRFTYSERVQSDWYNVDVHIDRLTGRFVAGGGNYDLQIKISQGVCSKVNWEELPDAIQAPAVLPAQKF